MLSVLHKYKYNHYRVSLNNEFRKNAMWWIEFFKTFNGLSYIPVVAWTPPDIMFSTDASLQGLGGVNIVAHEYFHVDIPEKFKDLHIGVNEMLAVYIALKLWQNDLVNTRLKIYCDNQSVIHTINSGKGRDGSMLHFARQISMICAYNNADIKLVYIDSKSNSLSDCLSRWSTDKKYREKFNGIISEAKVKYSERTVNDKLFDDSYDI